jgi:putative ABC transport system ATP-binding protein
MLALNSVSKSFNIGTLQEKQILNGFSLTVPKNQFVSIIGSNGSGKTTLLNLICGALLPEEGSISIAGKDITAMPEHQRYAFIGRVFQEPGFGTSPSMTLLENLSMADNKQKKWNLNKLINKDRIAYYKALLAKVGLGLENKLADKVGSFSGGQRQAVSLIMATMSDIKFLILDEHTASLDPKTADTIMEFTDSIVKEKKLTTLMVTHNLRYALKYGNRLLMMHEGQAIIDERDDAKQNLVLDDILGEFYRISIEVGNSV